MANLRRLSVPDLQALRAIILTVIDEGDSMSGFYKSECGQ